MSPATDSTDAPFGFETIAQSAAAFACEPATGWPRRRPQFGRVV